MSRPAPDVLPGVPAATRAESGTALLLLAMLLWSTAAGLFVQVLQNGSDPFGVGLLASLAAALLAAVFTLAGMWCTSGALPKRRLLVVALLVPALLLELAAVQQRVQERRQRDCPSLVGVQPYHLDRQGRCLPVADSPKVTSAG